MNCVFGLGTCGVYVGVESRSQERPSPNDRAGGAAGATSPNAKPADSGLFALASIAGHFHVATDPFQLAHDLGLGARLACGEDIVLAAQRIGLRSRHLKGQAVARLLSAPLPALIRMKDGGWRVALARLPDETPETLAAEWDGEIVLVTRRWGGAGADPTTFGFRWFLPSLWRYRFPLVQVLIASLFVQIFALVTPLMFQVVIDKVLVHKGMSTLVVIVVGLVAMGLFDVLLQYLRAYTLNHTTSRIDVELGSRLFDHLIRLPLAYFETRPTGQTIARVRELETVRSFLTGQGLSSAIDLLFIGVFVAVLFAYSATLTFVVLASIPCYLVIAALIRPILRDKINERFNTGAASQQFLVESVFGMQTLKAAAVEPILRNQWEERLAAYVRTSFQSVMLSSLGQNAIQYVNKVTTAVVLFLGAKAVIDNELTVGGLIAFNMIMNQVTAPILRLSQLWQDFQQVQISVQRLGDILNTPPEAQRFAQANLPPAKGAIRISDLSFRYRPDGVEILQGLDLDIPAGQVLGIVGPSGSGKSTLTKLLQRLYRPERGQILIDGIDISQVDTAWLRRQTGVVLQESTLFNRSIHDNIALANPGMHRTQVINVARLAGADEFIARLPLGYDTVIEERGANLSGGQRQRIAIARALATQPRILILDEATSALDYESERIIQDNMRRIAQGRTVIIIAHRLAAVRRCDSIIAIENGRIVEQGSHRELMARAESTYARLWRAQAHDSED